MDTPRDVFNGQLLGRYTDIPTDIPAATYLNVPVGARPCDRVRFLCHPQKYPNYHDTKESYRNINQESRLFNLDYNNPYDSIACTFSQEENQTTNQPTNKPTNQPTNQPTPQNQKEEKPLDQYYYVEPTPENRKIWRNTSKLDKYVKYPQK